MPISVDIEACDAPPTPTQPEQCYFVIIRGIPGAKGGLFPYRALPLIQAEKLRERIIEELVAFPNCIHTTPPQRPKHGGTFWDQLEDVDVD